MFISINCSTCFRRFLRLSPWEQNCTYSVRYCHTDTDACCCGVWGWTPWSSILSTIASGSGIGLTIPDTVCSVLCSWWWAEEPPEACRTIYRNKRVEKTLRLVGYTLEIHLRYTDIWTSNLIVAPLIHGLRNICLNFEVFRNWVLYFPRIFEYISP
jgi:hypothetical protein